MLPRLRVFVDPALEHEVDWDAFRVAFQRAGVRRMEILVVPPETIPGLAVGPHGRTLDVGLLAPRGRNPLLGPEDLAQGKTGPGSTEGRLASVHPDEISRFLWKHRERYRSAAGAADWLAIRRHLFTNTAVHEVWHAAAYSHSHNPVDQDSVMYQDPGAAALAFGTGYLGFTRGHRDRLEALFRPVLPWQDGLEGR